MYTDHSSKYGAPPVGQFMYQTKLFFLSLIEEDEEFDPPTLVDDGLIGILIEAGFFDASTGPSISNFC